MKTAKSVHKVLPLLLTAQEICARRSPSTSGERDFGAQSSVVQPGETLVGRAHWKEVM
jgi:hypothetical protein